MGSSKKVTIGYKYFFGIHMGLFRGPLDALLQIKVGDRLAWNGKITDNQRIYINKPKLFGGENKEGGIQGYLDVMMGAPDQPVNSRLKAMLGGIVPAFRGVSTLFYDGLVTAMNPYPKPWAIRCRRILKGWDGPVWYPEKAQIIMVPQKPLALYLALDNSGSMNTVTSNGKTRLQNMKDAINSCLDFIGEQVVAGGNTVDIMIVGWGTEPSARSSILRRNVTQTGISQLKSFVNAMFGQHWTYFPAGVQDMAGFYAAAPAGSVRIAFFVTDGEPAASAGSMEPAQIAQLAADIVAGVSGVAMHGINIDLEDTTYTAMVDNTASDGVPVVSGGDPSALIDVIMEAIGSVYAMNPAHIIYEAYTNRDWGRGLDASVRLDLDSFTAAADTLYAERFGMCIKWTRQDKLSVFVGAILDHIGGSIYISRRTGRLVLNLIRGDYDIEDLPLFTPDDGLLSIDDEDSSADDKAINCVVVKYRDPLSNEVLQVKAVNLAAITTHGLNQQTTEYIGIPAGTLAARVAQRDLTAYSSGVKKMKTRLNRRARGKVFPGSVFRISDPARGIQNLVLRAGRVEDGLLTSGTITVSAVKDVFGLPETSYAEPVLPGWTAPDTSAQPIEYQRLAELSYRDLVRITTPADMEFIDETSTFLLPIASKPTAMSMGYEITSRVGSSGDYLERGPGDFVASAELVADIGPGEQVASINVEGGIALDEVTVGMAALIDDEIVRVDTIDMTTGILTLGRGCVDTVPVKHLAGARVWFYEEAVGTDPTEYIAGSTLQAKLLSQTSSDLLPLDSAIALTLDLVGRQARPYPPGRLRLNGEAWPEVVYGNLEITFAHRDRLLQADQLVDTEATDIGPEPGTTYEVEIRDRSDNSLFYSTTGSAAPILIASAHMPFSSRLLLYAMRDGLRSPQAAMADFMHGVPLWTPADLSVALSMWLDDISALSESSGAINQWSDRSANSWHFSQTSSRRPTVSSLGVRRACAFNKSASQLLRNGNTAPRSIFRNTSAAWAFIVFKRSSTGTATEVLFGSSSGTNSGASRFRADLSNNKLRLAANRLDGAPADTLLGTTDIDAATPKMVLMQIDYASSRMGAIYLDGVLEASKTWGFVAGQTSDTVSAGAITVGSNMNESEAYFGGDIAVVLSGSGSLPTTDERDRLFGCYAWRHGLVDSLPGDHPYKLAPPEA